MFDLGVGRKTSLIIEDKGKNEPISTTK
jgi:hypothetical protein